jgi:DNA-directed RNA polymerase subunit RPC12/RpoP
MLCAECEKDWFVTASRDRRTCECPDCGSRLKLLETARPSEAQGIRVQ